VAAPFFAIFKGWGSVQPTSHRGFYYFAVNPRAKENQNPRGLELCLPPFQNRERDGAASVGVRERRIKNKVGQPAFLLNLE
jgi:hypothetical protein